MIVGTVDAAAEALSVGVLDSRRNDADVRIDDLHDPLTAERVRDDRGSGMRRGCSRACMPRMAGLATSGTLTHWFRENFARDLDPATAMATLAKEAEASPPGANGLVVLPYFSGERTPIHDPHAKGVLFGLT